MCEVSRSEFNDAFQYIAEDLKNATFIAFDTEFTGLTLSDNLKPSLFDTGELRYQKLRQGVQRFIPSQIGISAFIKAGDLNMYDVRTYNFYLYPVSFGPIDVRFLCQASSLEFLCRHHFDFNKFIYNGIPFLNESQENVLKKHLEAKLSHGGLDSLTLAIEIPTLLGLLCILDNYTLRLQVRDVDEDAIRECCSVVAVWLLTAVEGDQVEVPGPEAVSEYITLTELRLRFPDTWASATDGKIIVERVSAEKRKELEDSTQGDSEETKVLTSMLGFTRIFRLMAELKKPLVGHNCLTDLLIMYQNFHKPLPQSFAQFKADFTKLFPDIYDTKHIVNTIRRTFDNSLEKSGLFEKTALSGLYNSLESEKGRFFTLYQPGCRHDAGFDRYRDENFPHEAGYDAFMSGTIFLRLAHIISLRGKELQKQRPQEFREHLAALVSFRNCMNLIRGSTDYVKLDGQDPRSRRPQYLYVRSRKWNAPLNSLMVAQLFSQYGSVDIQMTDHTQALVAISNHGAERDILRKFRNDKLIHVVRYSALKHSPAVRRLLWAGVAVSTGLCVWVLWSGMESKR